MSDIVTYFVAARDSDAALRAAWAEHTTRHPGDPCVARHPDDVPARWKEARGHLFRVRLGASWVDGKPVLVAGAVEVEL